jgi:outer membrane lipoprotein-sorting protein
MCALGKCVFQFAFLLMILPAACIAQAASGDKIFASMLAKYASLNSYSDTGQVINEYGTSSRDVHKFTTLFNRAPRGYRFDFTKDGGEKFVIWGDPEAFHSWWSSINSQSDYPNPSNTGVFTGADVHTYGVATKVASLIYAKANLQSAFTNFTDIVAAGSDDVGGHKCFRLTGKARDIYSNTGRESNVRTMTIWVDTDSMFIRKIVEEWTPLPGQVSRHTTIYDPVANPTIDAAKFKFAPPK